MFSNLRLFRYPDEAAVCLLNGSKYLAWPLSALINQNPDVLVNSWGYLKEPDFKVDMDKCGIIPDFPDLMKKKMLSPGC